ncbi:hypothetical protein HELRODRAFT_175174 [Helobdella robusta]|uniref:Translation initiation factor 3 N-terminal domain-containing protein n=1 Tax=Helobdella robusta TaxID=6412 RepID=T1F8Y8_HELRO|nr:hypothetical protein HELRODRAFT_175174 [Helobdella robusta]ESO01144.1 hypothetical protein HELRODRAFT_175174 [Helobdella robusta]
MAVRLSLFRVSFCVKKTLPFESLFVRLSSQSKGTLASTRQFISPRGFNLELYRCAHKASSLAPVKHNVLVLDESDKEIGVMKWNRLKSLSIEKGLKICCVDESAQPHAIYKLVNLKTYIEIEKKQKQESKKMKIHQKSLAISSHISKNDLAIKIDKIVDWLGKNTLVKIKISFPSTEKKNFDIYNEILKATSGISKLQQSHSSENEITFDLLSDCVKGDVNQISNLRPFTLKELQSKNFSEKMSSAKDKHEKAKADPAAKIPDKDNIEKKNQFKENISNDLGEKNKKKTEGLVNDNNIENIAQGKELKKQVKKCKVPANTKNT